VNRGFASSKTSTQAGEGSHLLSRGEGTQIGNRNEGGAFPNPAETHDRGVRLATGVLSVLLPCPLGKGDEALHRATLQNPADFRKGSLKRFGEGQWFLGSYRDVHREKKEGEGSGTGVSLLRASGKG